MANTLTEGERFELFLEHLRATPSKMVERRLDEQLSDGAQDLLESIALQGQSDIYRIKATCRFALLAQAAFGLSQEGKNIEGPFKLPGWLKVARSRLDAFIAEDPTNRGALKQTVFYSSRGSVIRMLERVSNGSVVPAGHYDSKAFAAGLVNGEITLQLPLRP